MDTDLSSSLSSDGIAEEMPISKWIRRAPAGTHGWPSCDSSQQPASLSPVHPIISCSSTEHTQEPTIEDRPVFSVRAGSEPALQTNSLSQPHSRYTTTRCSTASNSRLSAAAQICNEIQAAPALAAPGSHSEPEASQRELAASQQAYRHSTQSTQCAAASGHSLQRS